MPIATSPKTTARTAVDVIDLGRLDHLHGHPQVAAILRKQGALRERLSAVDQAIQAQRRDIAVLEGDAVMSAADLGAAWQPSSMLQDARQRLGVLVDELRTLQAAQPHINEQVARTKDEVSQTLFPEVEALGKPVMERYLRALAEFQGAQEAAQAFASWAYRLVGSHVIPLGLIQDQALIGRLKYLHDTLRTQFRWTEGA